MTRFIVCDCDGPHDLAKGERVRVIGDDKEYVAGGLCTRGPSAGDDTKLCYFLIDRPLEDGDGGWPGDFVHHSQIVRIGEP